MDRLSFGYNNLYQSLKRLKSYKTMKAYTIYSEQAQLNKEWMDGYIFELLQVALLL